MKQLVLTLLVSILASTAIANEQNELKEFKREITKEFSVGTNPALHIENKYGQIRMVEGEDNKITFQIEIIGKGATEALAKRYAETVSIDFAQRGDKVSAKTVLESINCSNCGRTTNYTVIVPKGVTMHLDNKYGNIYLDNASKQLNVVLKYGNLEANMLADVKLDIKYGNASINACNDLNIDCGYAKLKVGKVDHINADSKYDEFQIGTVTDLTMNTKYTKVKIDKLNNSFVCNDFKYCTLNISDISTQFSRIKINAGYSNITLALDNRHSFKASLSARYGSIKMEKLTFNNVSMGNKVRNTESISGTAGTDNNPSATVDITASYGNIVFN